MHAQAPLRPGSVAAGLPGQRFLPGDPVPVFRGVTDRNPRYAFHSVAGRYVLLAFLGSASHPAAAAAWRALQQARDEGLLDDRKGCAFGVTIDPADAAPRLQDSYPGLRVLRDHTLAVSTLYGAVQEGTPQDSYRAFAMLLDPTLRVLQARPIDAIDQLLDELRHLPEADRHGGSEVPAPILVAPRVLEPDFCTDLVSRYRAAGGKETGFMRQVDGMTVARHDPAHKRRKDHEIEDVDVQAALRGRLVRRLAPEIRKAFQFEPTRIERYIVACYDAADGGHFQPHRDNTTLGTAHRRFAVSINLNDEFDGGDLRFPEFGSRTYRPPLGGAVVFSCSLLHEATRVMRGVRYATLPFLYDDAAARIRDENRKFLAARPG
jgi:predicted 2-oxoglutarate/Fe(II)-dependent dioxygenase YbiX